MRAKKALRNSDLREQHFKEKTKALNIFLEAFGILLPNYLYFQKLLVKIIYGENSIRIFYSAFIHFF